MARGRELKVFLTSDVKRFGKGLSTAESRVKRFGKVAGGAMLAVAGAAAAAAAAFGVEGVKAAVEDEKATAKLAKTFENLGKAQDVGKAEEFIQRLMESTGVADDELRPALEKLLAATGDTDTALGYLATAVDTAVGSGKPLATVTQAIAKGLSGSATALGKVAPGLDEAAIKADPLNSIMEQLNKRFGGQAATRMETFGGKADAIATAFGELQESFGKGLLGNLDGTGDSMGTMDDTLYSLGPAMEDLGATFGGIAISLAETAKVIGPVVDKFNELNSMGDGILTDGTLVQAMRAMAGIRYLTGVVTGNEDAANAAAVEFLGGSSSPNGIPAPNTGPNGPANYWGSFYGNGPGYSPMRYARNKGAQSHRANGRAAQRGARTNGHP